ncbi:MAG: diacylglycerol kinase [Nocardioidaceae bacterium]|jgi:YegS/Rv2252/BmrU family lipid kinase|nr:diacylglycerol kinase [Nocardioidaceae bacterium]
MESITLVSNASAGSTSRSALADVVRVLEESAPVSVVTTEDAADLEAALGRVTGPVVVAGGDGSLHAVINALHHAGNLGTVLVGLVPLGTGNDFARGVGIPLEDGTAAARMFRDGVRRQVDVLRDDEGAAVVNAVHAGVGAEAAREAQPWKPKLGKVGYAVGAVLAGVRTRGSRLRVDVDSSTLADGRRKVLQVAVGNGGYVGGGTLLVPDADPHDGWADVVVSFAVGPLERLRYAVRLGRGTHDSDPDVVTARGRSVTIEGPGLWLNTDGELAGPVTRRRWTVEPAAFTMMLPG